MALIAHTADRPGWPVLLARGAQAAAWRLITFATALKHRRDVARLLQFDDRMLADIGVTRGDVASTLALPIDRDPSTRLVVLAIERRSAGRALARERLERSRAGADECRAAGLC